MYCALIMDWVNCRYRRRCACASDNKVSSHWQGLLTVQDVAEVEKRTVAWDGISQRPLSQNRQGKSHPTNRDPPSLRANTISCNAPPRLNLQSWLPTHLFKPINHMLVGFGQVVCLPVGPRCDVCTLAKEKVCPSRVANVNAKGRKVVEFGFLAKEEVKPEVGGEGEGMELDLSRVRAKVEVEIEREGDGVKYEELVDVNTLAGSGLNEEERRLVEGAVESGVEGISAVEALGRIAEARGEVLVKVEAPDL